MNERISRLAEQVTVDDIFKLTAEYAAIDAVSGHEQALVRRLRDDLEPVVDEVFVDSFGNVVGTRHGADRDTSLMISAHSDEIGCLVKSIESSGAVRIAPIGGVGETLLVGRHVRVRGLAGVIGNKAGHISTPEERRTAPRIRDLYIDFGFDSREEVLGAGIQVGDPVAYYQPVQRLANANRIAGKAVDNRISCALVVLLARALEDVQVTSTIHFVVTVQEEVGLRGARMVTHRLNPTAAIAVDTMPAGGTPDVSDTQDLTMRIGGGPVITLASQSSGGGALAQPGMVRFLDSCAAQAGVKTQRGLFYGGNSDAASMHLVRSGVPVGILNLARRYSHSPAEMLDLDDALGALGVLVAAALGFSSETDLTFLGQG
ncbi:MAG TPA: M20/M25/M40 family metallo-hydrolase, partial [Thermomicrobiales bacterium]|nr:M20/M25/M40 family metallo-hydrolase [Thermomicrobiales bacterium]